MRSMTAVGGQPQPCISGGRSVAGDTRRTKDSAATGARAVRALGAGPRSKIPWVIGVVVVVIAAALVGFMVVGHHPKSTNAGAPQIDTNAALLASTAGQAGGEPVDGIEAGSMEQLVFHIHAHLAIYVNGQQKLVPYGIGIVPPYRLQKSDSGPFVGGGSKFYWLHTHDGTGINHIESPQNRTFTLGNLFDIWHEPLGPTQSCPPTSRVVALVNNQTACGAPLASP